MKKITLLVCFMLPMATFAQTTCATAEVITPGTYTVDGIAGTDIPDPNCIGDAPENVAGSEWYSFTPDVSGTYIVTSYLESNLETTDTRVHVYTGACGSLVCEAANDDINLDAAVYYSSVVFTATAGTTYLIAWDDNWNADGFDFILSALDCETPLAVPYAESFVDGVSAACLTAEDVDGNEISWITQFLDLDADGAQESFATNGSNGDVPKDDWLFTPAFALTGGTAYEITAKYNGAGAANESLAVLMTDEAASTAAFQEELGSWEGIEQVGDFATLQDDATTQTMTFTPAADGNFHIAFHTTSPENSAFLLLFDYTIDVALGTPGFETAKIKMYPNPVANQLNIANEDVIDSIEVYNLMGQKVLAQTANSNEVSVNMSQLSTGAYTVKVFSGNATSITKVIKQ